MGDLLLSRRAALRFVAVAPLALMGCRRGDPPRLAASRGDLPSLWARTLPGPWALDLLDSPAEVIAAAAPGERPSAAMLQLSDGWATTLPPERLRPLEQPALLGQLSALAAPVSRLYAPEGAPAVAFPWSSAPWVIVLRNRRDLAQRREEGWDLLLDPSLRGRLVLPSSPRVVIALMQGDPAKLHQLRRQAVAHDGRDGLNLLLSREADAAVLPRSRVVPALRRDPRLRAILPDAGAPLSWNLLLRTAGPHPDPPVDWLTEALEAPLLARLLAQGWVPPLSRDRLEMALEGFPGPLHQLLLPPESVLARCTSLPPLDGLERRRLQALWDRSAPGDTSGGG